MKALITIIVTAILFTGDFSKDIIGLWYIDGDETGTLEFRTDSTFTMVFYMEDSVSDTTIITGTYAFEEVNTLLLKASEEVTFTYYIEELKGDELSLKYNDYTTKCVRHKEEESP